MNDFTLLCRILLNSPYVIDLIDIGLKFSGYFYSFQLLRIKILIKLFVLLGKFSLSLKQLNHFVNLLITASCKVFTATVDRFAIKIQLVSFLKRYDVWLNEAFLDGYLWFSFKLILYYSVNHDVVAKGSLILGSISTYIYIIYIYSIYTVLNLQGLLWRPICHLKKKLVFTAKFIQIKNFVRQGSNWI